MQKQYFRCQACNAVALVIDAIPPATHRCGGHFEFIKESEIPIESRPNVPVGSAGVFYSG